MGCTAVAMEMTSWMRILSYFVSVSCQCDGNIGLSHARPNSGISGDLLSENEAKPAVI